MIKNIEKIFYIEYFFFENIPLKNSKICITSISSYYADYFKILKLAVKLNFFKKKDKHKRV